MNTTPALRVLVVEDEMLLRWSIAEALKAQGHTVVEAADASGALEVLTKAPPADAILLDYRLPDSKDFTLLRRIRQLAPLTPVVMMSAFGTPEIAEQAQRLGASAFLDKPFDVYDVAALIRRASRRGTGRG